jgi:ribosomal protein S18 acetylase RimI-like enzyme
MRFSIRPARRDDVPALLDMIGQLATHHGDKASTTADALLRDAFVNPPWIEILVAEAGTRLIGYTVLCPLYRAQFAQRGLDMHHLFIAQDWRGKGVGRALVEAMLARARELGCDYVKVGTHPDNVAAQEFYRAYGFQPAASGPQFSLMLETLR